MDNKRSKLALETRTNATKIALDHKQVEHISNGDERKFAGEGNYLASFTKGLPHNHKTGLIKNEGDFRQFVHATNTGDPIDFINTPLGPDLDAHENPQWHTQTTQARPPINAIQPLIKEGPREAAIKIAPSMRMNTAKAAETAAINLTRLCLMTHMRHN